MAFPFGAVIGLATEIIRTVGSQSKKAHAGGAVAAGSSVGGTVIGAALGACDFPDMAMALWMGLGSYLAGHVLTWLPANKPKA